MLCRNRHVAKDAKTHRQALFRVVPRRSHRNKGVLHVAIQHHVHSFHRTPDGAPDRSQRTGRQERLVIRIYVQTGKTAFGHPVSHRIDIGARVTERDGRVVGHRRFNPVQRQIFQSPRDILQPRDLLRRRGRRDMVQPIRMTEKSGAHGFIVPKILRFNGSIRRQHIPCATHRLKVARLFGVLFDLAPQAGDLHVHRSFLGLAPVAAKILNQLGAADGFTGFGRKELHQLHFGRGEANKVRALPHLAPLHVIADGAKRQDLGGRLIGGHIRHPAQDRVDAQQEFLGLERFRDVVIGPRLQPLDPVVGFALGGQQQDGCRVGFAQGPAQADPILAGHHHIHHDQVEIEAREDAPCMRGIAPCRHQKAMAHQEFLQQRADALIVIDDQQMCIKIAHVPLSFSLV
mmetsp:Transcript_24080/g.44519  ORF Transcript_24080/g.44519 Transcript_24080/m.44519 type:complete len:402 (-) Transcript_24080:2106-3311(-)